MEKGPEALIFFFWPSQVACRILVPQPEIKPVPPPVEAQGLNHGTVREVPNSIFKMSILPPSDLHIQCNSYQNLNSVFCRNTKLHPKVNTKFKETPNSQNNPEKAEQSWMIQTSCFKTYYKAYSNHINVILAYRQTYKPKE